MLLAQEIDERQQTKKRTETTKYTHMCPLRTSSLITHILMQRVTTGYTNIGDMQWFVLVE